MLSEQRYCRNIKNDVEHSENPCDEYNIHQLHAYHLPSPPLARASSRLRPAYRSQMPAQISKSHNSRTLYFPLYIRSSPKAYREHSTKTSNIAHPHFAQMPSAINISQLFVLSNSSRYIWITPAARQRQRATALSSIALLSSLRRPRWIARAGFRFIAFMRHQNQKK